MLVLNAKKGVFFHIYPSYFQKLFFYYIFKKNNCQVRIILLTLLMLVSITLMFVRQTLSNGREILKASLCKLAIVSLDSFAFFFTRVAFFSESSKKAQNALQRIHIAYL